MSVKILSNGEEDGKIVSTVSKIKEDADSKKIIKKDGYYCVPVGRFNKWHSESRFKRYTNTEFREALIIHDYATTNNGRNDYNVTGIGKTIRLKVPNEK